MFRVAKRGHGAVVSLLVAHRAHGQVRLLAADAIDSLPADLFEELSGVVVVAQAAALRLPLDVAAALGDTEEERAAADDLASQSATLEAANAQLAAAAPDNSVMMPFPVWREAFMNDADLALAESTYALLTPEPFEPFTAKLDLKVFQSLSIPRSYLNCLEDTALPPGEWGWHPRMSSRLGLYRLVQMRGGHEVVFTNPAGLALALIEAGRD